MNGIPVLEARGDGIARAWENSLVKLGRYCHLADSYHIYGSNLVEFEGRFLGALEKRAFDERTMRYQDVRDIMQEARPAILAKAQAMGNRAQEAPI